MCELIEPTFQRLLADLTENFVVIQYADPDLFELNLSKWKKELKNDIFLWNLNPNVDKLKIHELIAKFPMDTKIVRHCEVDNIQDFLRKLGMKPHTMHLLDIIIFSLYRIIVRPTKIMQAVNKNWAFF